MRMFLSIVFLVTASQALSFSWTDLLTAGVFPFSRSLRKQVTMTYKAAIVQAIQELGDRSGSSSIAIRKHIQAKMPKDKKWLNATYLSALKSAVAKGELVQSKNSYKLSADYKKKLVKGDKPKAAPSKAKKAKTEVKKKVTAAKKKKTTDAKKKTVKKKVSAVKKSAEKKEKKVTAAKKKVTTATKKKVTKKAPKKTEKPAKPATAAAAVAEK